MNEINFQGHSVMSQSYPLGQKFDDIGQPTFGVVHPIAPYVALAAHQEISLKSNKTKQRGNILSVWTPQ